MQKNNRKNTNTNIKKLELILIEIEDLLENNEIKKLCSIANVKKLAEILYKEQNILKEIIENDAFSDILKNAQATNAQAQTLAASPASVMTLSLENEPARE